MTILMKLGGYTFGTSSATYQKLQRATSYRWQAVERLQSSPAMQFMGQGRDAITLDGIMYPAAGIGDLLQMEAMRSEAGKGMPLMLVAAPDERGGTVHGLWCITQISHDESLFLPGGAPRQIHFTMELVAYGT